MFHTFQDGSVICLLDVLYVSEIKGDDACVYLQYTLHCKNQLQFTVYERPLGHDKFVKQMPQKEFVAKWKRAMYLKEGCDIPEDLYAGSADTIETLLALARSKDK